MHRSLLFWVVRDGTIPWVVIVVVPVECGVADPQRGGGLESETAFGGHGDGVMVESTSSGETADASLSIEGIHFGYTARVPVVKGLTASLTAGRLCALIGPNAAGKSTLLRVILGQLTPWSGTVRLCDQHVLKLSMSQRAAWMSYVPQRGGISFPFTVEQVVAMGRYSHRADPGAVEQALDACDLSSSRRRLYPYLSVGQQQRVMLARAMAQASGEGRVMLLDEPGSAMDLWHVHRTMRRLLALARSGLAVMMVLHDLDLAARYADDVWVLHQGCLAAVGRWDQVMLPQVLESVYGLRLKPIFPDGQQRPLFRADLPDTL